MLSVVGTQVHSPSRVCPECAKRSVLCCRQETANGDTGVERKFSPLQKNLSTPQFNGVLVLGSEGKKTDGSELERGWGVRLKQFLPVVLTVGCVCCWGSSAFVSKPLALSVPGTGMRSEN